MSLNTKHISTAVVLAIISFGIFAITINLLSSNGTELYGHPIILIINVLSLFGGLIFLYFAKWMRDAKDFKENQK